MTGFRVLNDSEKQALVANAEKEVGFKEQKGPNLGDCEVYEEATHNEPGSSYCESEEVYVYDKTFGTARRPFPATGSCQEMREWFEKNGLIRTTPGLCTYGWVVNSADHAHHAFLVTSDPSDGNDDAPASFSTVEGNTNTNGSSNGDGVYNRRRGADDDPALHANTYVFADIAIRD